MANENKDNRIEHGVPLPPPANSLPGKTKYPFAEMGVGDSVLFHTPGGRQDASKYGSAAYNYSRATGKKFAVRRVDKVTTRVWRVS